MRGQWNVCQCLPDVLVKVLTCTKSAKLLGNKIVEVLIKLNQRADSMFVEAVVAIAAIIVEVTLLLVTIHNTTTLYLFIVHPHIHPRRG